MAPCDNVRLAPSSFQVTESDRKSFSQLSAPSRGGGHAIIVDASLLARNVSSVNVTAPL